MDVCLKVPPVCGIEGVKLCRPEFYVEVDVEAGAENGNADVVCELKGGGFSPKTDGDEDAKKLAVVETPVEGVLNIFV